MGSQVEELLKKGIRAVSECEDSEFGHCGKALELHLFLVRQRHKEIPRNHFKFSRQIEGRVGLSSTNLLHIEKHPLDSPGRLKWNRVAETGEQLQIAAELHPQTSLQMDEHFSESHSSEGKEERTTQISVFGKNHLFTKGERNIHILKVLLHWNALESSRGSGSAEISEIFLRCHSSHKIRGALIDEDLPQVEDTQIYIKWVHLHFRIRLQPLDRDSLPPVGLLNDKSRVNALREVHALAKQWERSQGWQRAECDRLIFTDKWGNLKSF